MKTLDNEVNLNSVLKSSETKLGDIGDLHQNLYNYIKEFKNKDDSILISIVIPMFNEEKTIKKVLEDLPDDSSIEIIVVNDHSIDDSLTEIKKVKLKRQIRVINNTKKRGYGNAIMSGISHAKGKVIVTMDSDGQHSSDDIFNMVKPILDGTADFTLGSRYEGTYFYKLPVLTRLGEVIVEKLIQILFGPRICNNQTGFRAYDRKMLPIFKNTKYRGYAFCTEQILVVSIANFKIKECPIKVYRRQHGSSGIVLTRLAKSIFSCIFYYYFQKIKLLIKRNSRI
ncbi:MAG: glycosyltransferase family 2 protein [Candidatus Hermodarchaeota archaeon]